MGIYSLCRFYTVQGKSYSRNRKKAFMPGRGKIPLDKAAAADVMSSIGYSSRQIAAATGLNARSIRDIIARHGHWGEVADKPVFAMLRQQQNNVLEAAYRSGAALLFQAALEPAKLKKASTYQLVTSSAIAFDKSRLAAGEPTEIIASVDLHLVGNLDKLAARLSQTLVGSGETEVEASQSTSDK